MCTLGNIVFGHSANHKIMYMNYIVAVMCGLSEISTGFLKSIKDLRRTEKQ